MNEMTVVDNKMQQDVVVLDRMPKKQSVGYTPRYPVYDEQRAGKVIDELIAGHKDDRMNTKRAISGSIASAARVQNQNDRLIGLYERELKRKDLPEEQRMEILRMAKQAADSSADADRESREFVREEIRHSHRSNWLLIGGFAILVGGGLLLSAA